MTGNILKTLDQRKEKKNEIFSANNFTIGIGYVNYRIASEIRDIADITRAIIEIMTGSFEVKK